MTQGDKARENNMTRDAMGKLNEIQVKLDELATELMVVARKTKRISTRPPMKHPHIHVRTTRTSVTLVTKHYSFYFGENATICPTHGNDKECQCGAEEWAFVVCHRMEEAFPLVEQFRLPMSDLGDSTNSATVILLTGIGDFIDSLARDSADKDKEDDCKNMVWPFGRRLFGAKQDDGPA